MSKVGWNEIHSLFAIDYGNERDFYYLGMNPQNIRLWFLVKTDKDITPKAHAFLYIEVIKKNQILDVERHWIPRRIA